jgi:NADPH-dependent curcumin reductase CurA
VVESRADNFAEGDWVTDMLLWQDYAVTTPATARKLVKDWPHPTDLIGVLGIPGLSAWYGLGALGDAKQGETVVVTSAAGTVGAIAGQIAKAIGCRVVGTAGGAAKCAYVTDELGFDAAVDYQRGDVRESLRAAAPEGFDVLFDNVGNSMIEAALPLMRTNGRIVVCGQTAHYAGQAPPGIFSTGPFVPRRLTMQGLFVYDFIDDFPNALDLLASWRSEGKLGLRENIVEGFENLPAAFAALFESGAGVGKTIVKIAESESQR